MNMKVTCGLAAVALSLVLGPQAYAEDDLKTEEQPISIAGCVQRETDYRRQNNAGKGGFLGFGGGLGDEYVLVNASRGAEGAFGDCTTATGGEAYELTGSAEGDLERFIGQRVAIAGMLKEAEIDPATGRPTGGRQVGYDLRLFEVEVDSFRALAAPVRNNTVTRVEQQPQRVERNQQPVETERADMPARRADIEQLPRTASPLVLTGLIGLLSLAGVGAMRFTRRRNRF